MAKFCGNCGTQVPDNANVCSNCGTPFAVAQPAQPVQPVQQPVQPAQPVYTQRPVQPQYTYAPPKPPRVPGQLTGAVVDKVEKLLGVMVVVFAVMAAVGFLYGFIMAIVAAAGETVTIFGESFSSGGGFGAFVSGFASAVATTMKYAFYAIVTAIGAKLLKK